MKHILIILLWLGCFVASANQAQLTAGQVGTVTFTSGSNTNCANLSYTANGTKVYIFVNQVSNSALATVSATVNIKVGTNTFQQLKRDTSILLIQNITHKIYVGTVNLAKDVQYNFGFGAAVCYTNNCDTNSNNIAGGFTACVTPLPVELTSFSARTSGRYVRLDWATASEKNSARFEIEASQDGKTYHWVATQAAAGNSMKINAYSYSQEWDNTQTYYRLRCIDADNTFTFSPVVVATAQGKLGWHEYLAGQDGRYVAFKVPGDETPVQISVVDLNGRTLLVQAYAPTVHYAFGENVVVLRLLTTSGKIYSKLYR